MSSTTAETASQFIRKSTTVACVTMSSAWLGGILYSYYSIKNGKKMGEFDTFVFSLESLRNSFLIGGAIGLIAGSVITI
jgi:hypothetical protein